MGYIYEVGNLYARGREQNRSAKDNILIVTHVSKFAADESHEEGQKPLDAADQSNDNWALVGQVVMSVVLCRGVLGAVI